MRTLYLLRHGQTPATEGKIFCGATDVPLSANGRRWLLELRDGGGYPALSGCRVVTSGMKRTEETLAVLYGAVAHDCDPRLREMNFGRFEMQTFEQLDTLPEFQAWLNDAYGKAICPGGENSEMMQRRVNAAIEELLQQETRDTLVVTHGGPISFLMNRWFPGQREHLFAWQPQFGRGYALTVAGTRVTAYRELPQTP